MLDLDIGAKLCDLADKQNVKLAVNQNGRWSPHWSFIRNAIEQGVIGTVISAHLACHWNHNWVKDLPGVRQSPSRDSLRLRDSLLRRA